MQHLRENRLTINLKGLLPMKSPDQLFADIACKYLGIPTLESRRADSLDFHDVAVWQIKAALTAAFEAGAKAVCLPCGQPPEDLPTRFDDYEIQPCHRYWEADEPNMAFVEACEPFEADFWTVYGHIPGEGVQAIGDFDTREHAEEVFARITGRRYADDARPTTSR
jgi:hypothetical protein